jgi:hypothetical protein
MHTQFKSEDPERRDHLGDLGVDSRIILKRIVLECVNWMELSQHRFRWPTCVNTMIKRRFP